MSCTLFLSRRLLRRWTAGLALALPAIVVPSGADTFVLKDATVLVGDGTVLDKTSIKIADGQIGEIGPNVGGGMMDMLTRKVSLTGKVVTPGLLDVWSTAVAHVDSVGDMPAAARAADAFDPFAEPERAEALRRGITTVYIPARAADGLGGRGAVARVLSPSDEHAAIWSDAAGLHYTYAGASGAPAIARVRAADQLAALLQSARDYRDSLEDYEESLKEYEEKLKKRVESGETASKPVVTPKPETPPAPEPGEPPRPEGRRRRGPPRAPRETDSDAGFSVDLAGETPPKPGEAKDSKQEELKKPAEPKKDRDLDVVLDVLDGKLPLRVEVELPEDVRNVLEVARANNVALILEGASGASKLTGWGEEPPTVILRAEPPPLEFVPDRLRYRADAAAGELARREVSVFFASGPGSAPADLALAAARAVRAGMSESDAFGALTGRAAELLGVADKVGLVRSGLAADLVVWSAHPFSPEARVERVYIAGREVYSAAEANP